MMHTWGIIKFIFIGMTFSSAFHYLKFPKKCFSLYGLPTFQTQWAANQTPCHFQTGCLLNVSVSVTDIIITPHMQVAFDETAFLLCHSSPQKPCLSILLLRSRLLKLWPSIQGPVKSGLATLLLLT